MDVLPVDRNDQMNVLVVDESFDGQFVHYSDMMEGRLGGVGAFGARSFR